MRSTTSVPVPDRSNRSDGAGSPSVEQGLVTGEASGGSRPASTKSDAGTAGDVGPPSIGGLEDLPESRSVVADTGVTCEASAVSGVDAELVPTRPSVRSPDVPHESASKERN